MKPRIELQRHCIGVQDVAMFVFLFQADAPDFRLVLPRHCVEVQVVALFVFVVNVV